MKRAVAIIPARGGSRGILKKNLAELCGKPLIAWSILQARAARSIEGTYVSSDSDEILETAVQYGAIPIRRPPELATDTASSEGAWRHALDVVEASDGPVQLVIGMQATSPVRDAGDLDAAVEQFEREGCDSMLSCVPLADHFIWQRGPGGRPAPTNYDYTDRRPRQEIDTRFLENGSFYLFTPELLRSTANRLGGRVGLFGMPRFKSFQIDEPEDLRLVGAIMRGYGLDRMS